MISVQNSSFLKVVVITFSFWIILLPGPLSYEMLFTCIGLVVYFVYRRPVSELKKLPWSWFFIVMFFFVVLTTLPLFFHPIIGDAGLSIIQRRLGTILVVLYVFLLFWQLRPTEENIWWAIIFGAGAVAFYIGYEIWHLTSFEQVTQTRFGTTFTNPLRFGIYSMLLAVILMGGYFWAFNQGRLAIVMLTIALCVTILAALMSQTRSAWLGFPEAVIGWSVLYVYYLKCYKNLSLKSMLLGAIASFIILFFIAYSGYGYIEKRVGQGYNDIVNYYTGKAAGSVGSRFVMWEAAWMGFKDEPWRGVGLEVDKNYMEKATKQVMYERFGENRSVVFGHRHNQFVEEAYTRGILAIFGLAVTLGFLFWFFIKKLRYMKTYSRKDSALFSPWPLMGVLVTLAYFLAMQGEAILNLSAGIAHFFFITTFLVIMASKLNYKTT